MDASGGVGEESHGGLHARDGEMRDGRNCDVTNNKEAFNCK